MLRLLGALGIGAAAMYFFDPENGRRRRALLRDKYAHYRKEATEYAQSTAQDLRGMVERRREERPQA